MTQDWEQDRLDVIAGSWRTKDEDGKHALICELAIYLAASLHAKWPIFRTAVRVRDARTAGRPDKSPIAAR